MDTWLPQQVSFMAAMGNAAANSYWEAKLTPGQKPHYESSDLEPFIRRKYCNKEFAEGTWPPSLPNEASTPGSAAKVARKQQGGSSNAVPQLASDVSAGRLEAGGFWGSLTPQESGVPLDMLQDGPVPGIITPGRLQSQRLPQSQQPVTVSTGSPALLIDLMDFGAEATFQLPTTPRRSGTVPSLFGSAGGNGATGNVGVSNSSSSSSSREAASGSHSSGNATAASVPAVMHQRSGFPLLPPPPQVRQSCLLPQDRYWLH